MRRSRTLGMGERTGRSVPYCAGGRLDEVKVFFFVEFRIHSDALLVLLFANYFVSVPTLLLLLLIVRQFVRCSLRFQFESVVPPEHRRDPDGCHPSLCADSRSLLLRQGHRVARLGGLLVLLGMVLSRDTLFCKLAQFRFDHSRVP